MTLAKRSLHCILNVVLQSFKHEEINVPREFIFVFIPCFTGDDFVKKVLSKVGGSEKI